MFRFFSFTKWISLYFLSDIWSGTLTFLSDIYKNCLIVQNVQRILTALRNHDLSTFKIANLNFVVNKSGVCVSQFIGI